MKGRQMSIYPRVNYEITEEYLKIIMAAPTETEKQRKEREAGKKRLSRIETLTAEIAVKQREREQLMKGN